MAAQVMQIFSQHRPTQTAFVFITKNITSHHIRFVVYVCPDSKRSFAFHIMFYLNYTKLKHNKMQLIKPLDQKIYHKMFFFVPLLEM